jgi:hypothetical protein
MSVVTSYGKNSVQYLQAGGKVRKPGKKRVAKENAIASAPMTTIISPSPAQAKTNGKGTQAIAH